MIPEEALDAAREAMRCVTPPPGVSKTDWLAEHGSWALLAGAIAAAAPFLRAQALENAADDITAETCAEFYNPDACETCRAVETLRARAVTERGGDG